MSARARQVLLFFALNCLVSLVSADELLDQAQQLIDAGNAAAAYDLLKPHEEARAGDSAFDYRFGLAALNSGRALEAVFALERAVDADPQSVARAELARAYLELGDTDEAKGEFEKIKQLDVPTDVQQTIDRYLAGIDSYHDKTRTRWRPYFKTGLGYDTNVNGAADENRIAVPALGGLIFTLDDPSREANSPIWTVGGGVRITSPLDVERGMSLFVDIDLDHRLALDEADFSTTVGNGRLGINWEHDPKNQFSVSLDGNTLRVEGSTGPRGDREVLGTTAQWRHTYNQANQFTLFGQASMVRYPEQRVRDVNRYTGGLGWAHAFLDTQYSPIAFVTVFGGTEDEKSESRGRHFSNNFYGVRGGGRLLLDDKHSVFGSITYEGRDYQGTDPTFLEKRDDDFFEVSAGYRYQFDRNWSVTPSIVYNNNDSNLPTSDYDRVEFMVTVRNDF